MDWTCRYHGRYSGAACPKCAGGGLRYILIFFAATGIVVILTAVAR